MPNYNRSGGLSRNERKNIRGGESQGKRTIRGIIAIIAGFAFFVAAFAYRAVTQNSEVTSASYLTWVLAIIAAVLLIIGVHAFNGNNPDVVAKREMKAQRRAQKRAAKR